LRRFAASLTGFLLAVAACGSQPDVAPPPSTETSAPDVGVTPTAPALFDDRLPPAPQAKEHVPAPWQFDVKHYAIQVAVKYEERAIDGRVTIDVDDAADGLTAITLDAVAEAEKLRDELGRLFAL